MDDEGTLQARLKANAQEDVIMLGGMWASTLYIALPALVSLPIMWLFGEGDYIVPVLALLWVWCFRYGLKLRRTAPVGSMQRSKGFWVSAWSLILALSMILISLAFLIDGNWRWTPPAWH